MRILENQCFEANNLISVRKKANQADMQNNIVNLMKYIISFGADKAAPIITATYSVDDSADLMDTEVFIPVNMAIPSNDEYTFKPRLYLDNCVKATHIGYPESLQNVSDLLNDYIIRNKLSPITCGFSVMKNEVSDKNDSDKIEVDFYVSISRNKI